MCNLSTLCSLVNRPQFLWSAHEHVKLIVWILIYGCKRLPDLAWFVEAPTTNFVPVTIGLNLIVVILRSFAIISISSLISELALTLFSILASEIGRENEWT